MTCLSAHIPLGTCFASAAGSLTSGLAGAGSGQRGQAGSADSQGRQPPEELEHRAMADAAGRDLLLGWRNLNPH